MLANDILASWSVVKPQAPVDFLQAPDWPHALQAGSQARSAAARPACPACQERQPGATIQCAAGTAQAGPCQAQSCAPCHAFPGPDCQRLAAAACPPQVILLWETGMTSGHPVCVICSFCMALSHVHALCCCCRVIPWAWPPAAGRCALQAGQHMQPAAADRVRCAWAQWGAWCFQRRRARAGHRGCVSSGSAASAARGFEGQPPSGRPACTGACRAAPGRAYGKPCARGA